MSEKFRRSALIRFLRSRLIKDGLSEDDADTALEELRKEFSAIPDDDAKHRRLISEKLGQYLAEKRLGEGADPQDLKKYAKRYEDIIVQISTGLAVAAAISATSKGGSSETDAPSAAAPLPAKRLSAEGQFRWPIDDPTAIMQFTLRGILLAGHRDVGVEAAANGVIRVVEQQHRRFYVPIFLIMLDHPNGFQTFYSGWGNPLVKRGVSIKAPQQIATSTGACLYFQMAHAGHLVDPRSHLPSFPGSVWKDGLDFPAALELIEFSRRHYLHHASPTAIFSRSRGAGHEHERRSR